MKLSFLFESFENQTYSYERAGPEYSVSELYRYAEEDMGLISLPTSSLVHNIKVSGGLFADELVDFPAFRRRAMRSDLARPILVHKADNEYWIIDGIRNVMKASEFKKKYMKAYVFVGNLPAQAQVRGEFNGRRIGKGVT